MATTTNYSWTTPDDTDLVKDGASAIRTLGSSADTTVKALNPGTTAGDIDYYTTSTAKARIGIGTAGQVLAVNSGATAPEWITSSSGGMTLISTTTLSGATVTLSSIPQTYNELFLVFRNFLPANDGSSIYMRFNGDSTANRHVSLSYYTTFYYNTAFSFGATASRISTDNDNAVSNGLTTCQIFDYTNTTTWKMAEYTSMTNDETNTAQYKFLKGAAHYNQTSAITSLSFIATSGNFTSGSVLLYGVK